MSREWSQQRPPTASLGFLNEINKLNADSQPLTGTLSSATCYDDMYVTKEKKEKDRQSLRFADLEQQMKIGRTSGPQMTALIFAAPLDFVMLF